MPIPSDKNLPAFNGGIGKIAALPSFENIYYFCRELLVGKSVEAATSPIPRNVACYRRTKFPVGKSYK
jgi:hypothetical protein